MDMYRLLIRENIEYDQLRREYPYDMDLIDGYVELMAETCCNGRDSIRVNQEEMPSAVVRGRLLKLKPG